MIKRPINHSSSINSLFSRLSDNFLHSDLSSYYYACAYIFSFSRLIFRPARVSCEFSEPIMDKQELLVGCHAKIPGVGTSYGYVPSLGAGIAFCVLFGISMILHTAQMCWKRTWWTSVFSIGCIGKFSYSRFAPRVARPVRLTIRQWKLLDGPAELGHRNAHITRLHS